MEKQDQYKFIVQVIHFFQSWVIFYSIETFDRIYQLFKNDSFQR